MFLNNQSTTLMLGTRPGPFTGFGNIADPMSATKEGDEGGGATGGLGGRRLQPVLPSMQSPAMPTKPGNPICHLPL